MLPALSTCHPATALTFLTSTPLTSDEGGHDRSLRTLASSSSLCDCRLVRSHFHRLPHGIADRNGTRLIGAAANLPDRLRDAVSVASTFALAGAILAAQARRTLTSPLPTS
jgi:hypothetical protein